jgi:hypothetical protein
MIELPSAKYLASLLDYDPETGSLIWRPRPATSKVNKTFNAKCAKKEAGAHESWGYRQIRIDGRLTMAHRIIWKMMTGSEPPDHLDHVDGNVANNRWINIRAATSFSNRWNAGLRRNNTSGFPCIYPLHTKRPTSKKFRVVMYVNQRKTLIGDFHTFEEAKAAYETAFDKHRNIEYMRTTP